MNGQLSEQPLAELIREISAKSLSGRLSLEHDRIKVVSYFEVGTLVYAASNLRTLRIREYLKKTELVSEADLARFNDRLPDIELLKQLIAQKLLSTTAADQIHTRQVTDVLRVALVWTDGTWELESRARLNEQLDLKIDVDSLLLEAASRIPPPEPEEEPMDVEAFLERVRTAQTYYDVLGVSGEVSAQNLKDLYYKLARRYHPDRFRKSEAGMVKKIESAFARMTQAYDTLRDDRLRATYDSKLQARRKAEQLAQSAPKATKSQSKPVATGAAEPSLSAAERAEMQFKEGFAALELGQRKVALGLFASAASAAPKEPRYRAFYGQMLAANEATRRVAETELLAAVKLDPQNAAYRVMLAELYRDLGLKLRAKGEAERAVAADPNNEKARDLLRSLE
jgi:hypothetical protein